MTSDSKAMDEPLVTLANPSVSLNFGNGDMEIRGHLTWEAGPYPEVVWVWAYFLNPGEAATGVTGSRSSSPIKLLHPLRHNKSAEIVARGHFHWWDNSDAPRQGYLAKVTISAASSDSVAVPVRQRDYSALDAVPVESKGLYIPDRETKPGEKRRDAAKDEYEVALSYAGEDRAYVEKVAKLLRRAGINVFYDRFEEVELWGKDLTDHLADIYARRSRWVVFFISAHYAEKAWPNHERKHALARAINDKLDNILPARFDDTELPGLASTVAYVDLRKTTPESLANMIIQKVRS